MDRDKRWWAAGGFRCIFCPNSKCAGRSRPQSRSHKIVGCDFAGAKALFVFEKRQVVILRSPKLPWKFLTLVLLVLVPSVIQGEVIYLKDGSTLNGKLVRIVADTLYFKTSFGAELPVPRASVLRIDFAEASQVGGSVHTMNTDTGIGSLIVYFDDFELTSKISMHRGRDEEGHIRENSIQQMLLVNEDLVFSHIDSTTDKTIRDGTETRLQNKMKPKEMRVGLKPGIYSCQVVFGNSFANQYKDRFDPRPLRKEVVINNVEISSNSKTVFQIELKKKKLGLGGTELRVTK